jgi:hypothetical protein
MAENETDSKDDRAENAVEAWSRRAGKFIASAAARAREEAEDIWAEAQSVRKGKSD